LVLSFSPCVFSPRDLVLARHTRSRAPAVARVRAPGAGFFSRARATPPPEGPLEPGAMTGRKVTMNDLFAEPEADGGDDKVSRKLKSLDGMNTKSRVHIQKSAVQGEFGAKKFIKP
jgi:hypothetical protein